MAYILNQFLNIEGGRLGDVGSVESGFCECDDDMCGHTVDFTESHYQIGCYQDAYYTSGIDNTGGEPISGFEGVFLCCHCLDHWINSGMVSYFNLMNQKLVGSFR